MGNFFMASSKIDLLVDLDFITNLPSEVALVGGVQEWEGEASAERIDVAADLRIAMRRHEVQRTRNSTQSETLPPGSTGASPSWSFGS